MQWLFVCLFTNSVLSRDVVVVVFARQPVTTDEVARARVSPLAMSLLRPPDEDDDGDVAAAATTTSKRRFEAMTFREQREHMAQHAASTLMTSSTHATTAPRSDNSSDVDDARRNDHVTSAARSAMSPTKHDGDDDVVLNVLPALATDGVAKDERTSSPKGIICSSTNHFLCSV